MISRKGFHDSGPIGERDYEDAGMSHQGLTPLANPIREAITDHESELKRTEKSRWALRTKLVSEFTAANNRKPLPSELTNILRTVNREVK